MVDSSNDLGDSVVPVYEFEWSDGTVRDTKDLPAVPDGIEVLAYLGRDDEDCIRVDLVGWET